MRNVHELYQVEFSDGVKGALGIDERGQLYWNGDPVITGSRVLLPWWVDLSIAIGSLSLFVIAAPLAWSYLAPLV